MEYIIFNNLEEMQPYYDKKSNTYVFVDNGNHLDIKINFDLRVKSSIYAGNINACNITAYNINACNITAYSIDAYNIDAYDIYAYNINALGIDAFDIRYYAVCFAYCAFKCKSVSGRRQNSRHFCLDSEIVFKEEA